MQPFRYHVLVCEQGKAEGLPACREPAQAVSEALRRELTAHGLSDKVLVTSTGCLGLCERGPHWVVYPGGVWYSGIAPLDVREIVREHFQHGRPVERLVNRDQAAVRQAVLAHRKRAEANLGAREAAGALPEELLEMVRGFQPSRILLSALELELFSAVAELGPTATASEIARRLDADLRATEVLLNALVALKMLSKTAGIFANSALAARYLVRGDPADSRDALRHHSNLWTTWSQLTECVRRGKPARWEEMAERGSDWTTSFIAAMHKNAALRAPLLVQAIGAQGVNRLLDVGGGSGAYSITFALANPGLSAQVFDLPSVIPIAEQQIAAAGLQNRVSTRVGDLREDVFESGFDLVLLSAICHMLGPDENRDLFRRAYAALLPGGRLAIQDHVMHEDKTAPRAGALFAVNMLVGTPQGGTYSWFEYRNFLEQVGFEEVEKVDLPGPNQLVLANKGRSA